MAKRIIEQSTETKKVVGVQNPERMKLYDELAQFLSNKFQRKVDRVSPIYYYDEKGKKKKTGSYGLAFEFAGTLATLEIVLKGSKEDIKDFVIEETTLPD